MAKFKKGDIVLVVQSGAGTSPADTNRIVTIVSQPQEYFGDELGYVIDPPLGNCKDGNYGGVVGETSFELVSEGYPKIAEERQQILSEIQVLMDRLKELN
jgi:hypothetical protein